MLDDVYDDLFAEVRWWIAAVLLFPIIWPYLLWRWLFPRRIKLPLARRAYPRLYTTNDGLDRQVDTEGPCAK